jgi:tetratricopeptide (TPR) repeat protein
MKKYLFYLFTLIIGVSACKSNSFDTPESHNVKGKQGGVKKEISNPNYNNKQTKFSIEVLKLNEQAVLLINEGDEISYQKAIKLLDKAISLDTMYYVAYTNKAGVLTSLGKYREAIDVYTHIITKIKADYPEVLAMLGMLCEKIGEKTIANEYYEKAINEYTDRINLKKDVWDMVNKAHLNYILDKRTGLKEMDSLIKVYPKIDELPMYKEYMFLGYDHQKALDDL